MNGNLDISTKQCDEKTMKSTNRLEHLFNDVSTIKMHCFG